MSTSFTGQTKVIMTNNFDNVLDLTTPRDALSYTATISVANGSGANKAQVQWHDTRTLTSGSADNLDLAGSLASAFGTVTFTKIKGILIRVTTETSNYRLEVGGAASNACSSMFGDSSDVLIVGAGGLLLLTAPVDGYTVTAGTGDILKINNPSAGAVTYDIIIFGEGSVA